jgi:hypothetical protein
VNEFRAKQSELELGFITAIFPFLFEIHASECVATPEIRVPWVAFQKR